MDFNRVSLSKSGFPWRRLSFFLFGGSVAQASSITTLFVTDDNDNNAGGAVYFDADVVARGWGRN
jgi:hypothetical protein